MIRLPRARGFTLVEVVIAVALVSLIMLALVAALRTFGVSATRLEEISLRADSVRLVERFLRGAISGASPRLHVRSEDLGAEPWFRGASTEMVWVGPVPPRNGAGGLYHLRLSLSGDVSQRLVLQMLPFAGDDAEPDWSTAPEMVLLEPVGRFSVAYQRLGRRDWSDAWADPAVLPARVRLSVSSGGTPWPDLVFRVLVAQPGDQVAQENAGGGR